VSRFETFLTFAALSAVILVAALLLAPSVNAQSLDEMANDLIPIDLLLASLEEWACRQRAE